MFRSMKRFKKMLMLLPLKQNVQSKLNLTLKLVLKQLKISKSG